MHLFSVYFIEVNKVDRVEEDEENEGEESDEEESPPESKPNSLNRTFHTLQSQCLHSSCFS